MSGQIEADVIRVCKPKAWFVGEALRKGQEGWTTDTKEQVMRDTDALGTYRFFGESGASVPEGGSAGQVLTKASGEDFDMAWRSATGGGTAPGNGRIDLVIGQEGREVSVGSFTVNQTGNTKIILDSSFESGGNEGHLLSNVPHIIRVTGGTQNNPVIEGDGQSIPNNKMFLIIESSTVNNPVLKMWTPLTERAFYVINKFEQTVALDLSATPGGVSMRFNISGKSGMHFLISELGLSNIVGSMVSFGNVS